MKDNKKTYHYGRQQDILDHKCILCHQLNDRQKGVFCSKCLKKAAQERNKSFYIKLTPDQLIMFNKIKHKDKFSNRGIYRFISRLHINNTCWEWYGSLNKGYGDIHIDSKRIKSHRLAYELYIGDILDNKLILHHCDNPICCNPDHLYAGTPLDNMTDAMKRNRLKHKKGEDMYCSKLKDQDIIFIRQSNLSINEMAEKFNVCRATIQSILNYKTWKHIK